MELILVRHPETEANAKNLFYSESDSPFTKRGIVELNNIVSQLKDLDYCVYTSPLKRAVNVAQLLTTDFTVDERLAEIDFGLFKGMTLKEVQTQYPQDYEEFTSRNEDYQFPDGENYDDFFDRITEFFDQIIHENCSAIVISHGGVINMVLKRYFELDRCYPGTGSIIRLNLVVDEVD